MPIRTVTYELEAKLTGPAHGFFSRPSGKLERKLYGDGTHRLKIRVRNLKAPDDSLAVVTAGGEEIAQIPLTKGAGRLDIESTEPDAVPTLEKHQLIEVAVDGDTVLSGQLYVD